MGPPVVLPNYFVLYFLGAYSVLSVSLWLTL